MTAVVSLGNAAPSPDIFLKIIVKHLEKSVMTLKFNNTLQNVDFTRTFVSTKCINTCVK